MKGAIVYDSYYGNTRKVAEALRDGLATTAHSADVLNAKETGKLEAGDYDFLLLGGPTRMFRASRESMKFAQRLPRSWTGKPFATFDTELLVYRGPSGASLLAKALTVRGLVQAAEPLVTHVTGGKGPLADDALFKAKTYAETLTAALEKAKR